MFKPASTSLSTEHMLDSSSGEFSFSDSSVIGLLGDSLRQLPQISTSFTLGTPWPQLNWTHREEFLPTSGSIESGWDYSFNNFGLTTPVQWEFDLQQEFLKVETTTGEYFYIEQSDTGVNGTVFTGVNNADGFTLQTKIQVHSVTTGSAETGFSLFISDGTKSADIYFVETGFGIRNDNDAFIVADMTVPTTLRIAAKQDDIYFLLDNGLVYAGINKFTGNDTANKKLRFGNTGAGTSAGTAYIDYIYQYHSGMVVDTGEALTAIYNTDWATGTTPEFYPKKNVKEFSAAYFDLGVGTSGGTTAVLPQYKNSDTADIWTNFNSYVTLSSYPRHEFLLNNIPTAGDGTDKLRFQIRMQSTDGSAEAARVDKITLASRFDDVRLIGFPRWGPEHGGNTVGLNLYSTKDLSITALPTSTTRALYTFNDTGTSTGVAESVDSNSGQLFGEFTKGVASDLSGQIQLGDYNIDTGSKLETLFTSTYTPTGYMTVGGEIATGFQPYKTSSGAAWLYFEQDSHVTGSSAASFTGSIVPAQKIYTSTTGDGISIVDITTTGVGPQLFNMTLHIEAGALQIQYTTDRNQDNSLYCLQTDYSQPKNLKLIVGPMVPDETGILNLISAGNLPGSGPAIFTVSDLHISTLDTGYMRATLESGYELPVTTGIPNSGWSIDAFYTPYAYNIGETGSQFFNITGASHSIDLTTNDKGYPIATIVGENTTILTGNWPLYQDKRQNVCLTYYNRTGTDTGYAAILVDGEINALERTNAPGGQLLIGTGNLYIGARQQDGSKPYYGLVDQFRFNHAPAKPEAHAQSLGITDIYFRDVLEVPAYTGDGTGLVAGQDLKTVSLLHFNERNGPIVDDLEFWNLPASEVLTKHERRNQTTRDIDGVIGGAIYCSKTQYVSGGFYIPDNTDLNPRVASKPYSIFFYYGGYTDTGSSSSLVRYLNDSGNYGFEISLNISGQLQVETYNGGASPGNPITHTGTLVGTNKYTACAVTLNPLNQQIVTMVNSTVETGDAGSNLAGFMTGDGFSSVDVGYGVMGAIDQFTIIQGLLDIDTFNILRYPTSVKGLPNNQVFVGGTQLHAERVLPIGPRKLQVVMPEGTGETHVYANINNITVSMDRPYKYVKQYTRSLDVDSIEASVCSTKSPFRIGDIVPDGSVGLAVINSPELSVVNNMSFVDLSDRELGNISNYLRGEFSISAPEYGSTDLTYSGQIDTQEVLVSNRSVQARKVSTPSPLYYKYLLGHGRYYLHKTGATTSSIRAIKAAIRIVDADNNLISQSDYPWDIEIASEDINGNALPQNVFSVILFTHKKFIPDKTVFVVYRAIDSKNDFKLIPEYKEVVNPVPIFNQDTTNRRDTFSLSFTTDGTYDITIVTG